MHENRIIMRTLRYVCTLLSVCGCLRPSSWTSPSKRILYRVYTAVVWLLIHTLAISQVLDLIVNVENQDDFSDNFYVTLAALGICLKMCNVLMNQRNIGDMIDRLEKEPFSSVNKEEDEIRTRFDKVSNRNTLAYTMIIKFYVLSMCLMSVFNDFRYNKLLYRAWLPYDYSTSFRFTVTYVHQIVAIIYCAFITVACDSLFSGVLIHTYCHFEILGHRLKSIAKNDSESAKQCVYLHDHIYKYATMLNKQFKVIMFSQSLVSINTVCFNLYQLTQRDLGSKLFEVILYSFNTLMQIFYYCWYGNEVKLKSLEVPKMIFECDWACFDNDTRMTLLLIMRRATIPVEFSSIHVVSMDLDTFTKVLKMSYSAYNLLQ